jgi:hypothetical protein
LSAARDIASLSKGKVWVLHLQELEWEVIHLTDRPVLVVR